MKTINTITEWLKKFAQCVRSMDFDGGAKLFDTDIYCFGSQAETLYGRDDLVERQWREIWPNIEDFDFQYDQLHCILSKDETVACAMLPWTSTGFDADSKSFQRPGRVTILLRRNGNGDWLAYHSHYSLAPGTRQTKLSS